MIVYFTMRGLNVKEWLVYSLKLYRKMLASCIESERFSYHEDLFQWFNLLNILYLQLIERE